MNNISTAVQFTNVKILFGKMLYSWAGSITPIGHFGESQRILEEIIISLLLILLILLLFYYYYC